MAETTPETNTCEWYDPTCALTWIGDELSHFGLRMYDSLLDGCAYLIELLPVPDFMLNLPNYTVPSELMWAGSVFQLEFGFFVVITAYTSRFILRRIPFIG